MGNFCCCDDNTEEDVKYINNLNNKEFTPLRSTYDERDPSVRYIRIDSLDYL